MRFRHVILALSFAFPLALLAQMQPPPISIGSDAPDWFFMMQEPKPNVRAIAATYDAYYRAHKFEKNSYTNYYKRWMRWAKVFEQADGSLYIPTIEEENAREQKLMKDRQSTGQAAERGAMPGPWTFIGPKQTYDTDGVTKVTWQTNCYSVDVSRANSSVILAGGETGGLFRTTDKGLNWTPLTHGITHGSFGAVKNHPTNTSIFYAATSGKIIKSIDGGATLSTVYSSSNFWVNEFAISTTNPDIVLAACDNGLLRSTNGGTTWSFVFTNKTWAIKQKPGDGNTFFAVRKNGTSSDFVYSTNAGASWTVSNSGIYTPIAGEEMTGAILGVCPSEPNRVYAYYCGSGSNLSGYIGVFKSTNSGVSWTNAQAASAIGNSPTAYNVPNHVNLMSSGGLHNQLQQGFYDMAFFVNPNNADQLLAGGTSWWKSTDGGVTWNALGGYAGGLAWSHPDIQWIDGVAGETWIASDGGLNYSTDFFSSPHEARMNGIAGSDMWGFDQGWNEDILVGGRYHNGNMGFHQSFSPGQFYRLGGGEASTGYVNPGRDRKVYHSDIGGHIFRGGFTAGVSSFPVGDFPNEHYSYYQLSEMSFHPHYYNTVFIGKDNKLRVSTDGGTTFTDKYTFPGAADKKVFEIEICRSNPQVMYVSQWDGTDDKLWKSTDGGTTFTAMTPLPLPNNNDRVRITASATDANVLWVAVTYGGNGKKIYKSTNGGASWVNLTTSVLDGYKVEDILAAHGTDGGIYASCNGAVFYRNNTLSNWVNYSSGLPLSFSTLRIKPFYKEGKIRLGANGFGVWEAPLYETSTTVARAMVDKKTSYCNRDTFYFDDYSVVNHTGSSWAWTFPGAATVIGANTRAPKVLYTTPGNYTATMMLTTPSGNFNSSVSVEVLAGCDPDTIAGQVLRTATNGDYIVSAGANLTNLTEFTVTGWWKPNGAQEGYAALFSSGDWCAHCDGIEGLIFDYFGNKLWYRWPAGNTSSWGTNSGIDIPLNEWSYVALVIRPTGATLYLNEKKFVHTTTLLPGNIENIHIGYGHYSHSFKGDIDEVTMWNRALTDDEIRRLRHITKEDVIPTDPNLLGYWQFNEIMPNGDIQDNAGIRHGRLKQNAVLATSTAPVGGGSAQLLNLVSGITQYNYPSTGTNVQMSPCDTYNGGTLVSTRLNTPPNIAPVPSASSNNLWLFNYYGAAGATAFAPVENIELTVSDPAFLSGIANANEAVLHTRTVHGEASTWSAKAKGVTLTGNKLSFNRNATLTGATQISLSDGAPAFVEIDPGSPCGPDSISGNMLVTTGSANSSAFAAAAPQFGAAQDFSISIWFKTTSTTADGTIFGNKDWDSGVNAGWIFAITNGKIWWNVADGTNRMDQRPATPIINDGRWHHFAATCDRNGLSSIYLNGQFIASTSMAAVGNINNTKKLSFGADDEDDWRVAVEIDEANIYNRLLTVNELRELAHLTRTGFGNTTGQINYYQFQNTGTTEFDRKGTHHLTIAANASRSTSTLPLYAGRSQRIPISGAGATNFADVGVTITFASGGTYPAGDVVVSRLNSAPVAPFNALNAVGNTYWVMNNHGANSTFTSPTSLIFSGLPIGTNIPSRYKLYRRIFNGHLVGDWSFVDIADAVTTGSNGTVTFSTGLSLTSGGQLAIFDFADELPSVNLTNTFIQGYMVGSQMLPVLQISGIAGATANQTDTVTISLHQSTSPYTRVHTFTGVLNTNGTMEALFPPSANNTSWYIVINGRNLLETWSATPVTITPTSMYSFASAYGNNLGMVGSIPVIYSGNIAVPQDENIDLVDYPAWEAAYNNFTTGYHWADLNGDGNVDLIDYPIWEANYNQFISVMKP